MMTLATSLRPEPISPAMPVISPGKIENDMLLTTFPMRMFSTRSTGKRGSNHAGRARCRPFDVEIVADHVANETVAIELVRRSCFHQSAVAQNRDAIGVR